MKLAEEYADYYAGRSAPEAREERSLLDQWSLSDQEAWAILDKEARRGSHPAR